MWTTALLVFISAVLAAGAWLVFLWAVKSDQFDDVERPKHRMLDEDEQGGPGAAAPGPRESGEEEMGRAGRRRRGKLNGAAGEVPRPRPRP